MFLRRKKLTWVKRIREYVWPTAGWKRALSYQFHRMARLPGSPFYVAAGFACGAAISFTPFVGTHLAFGCLMAWALRASLLAAAVGTLVGNPWTFPFIWIWIYQVGRWILGDSFEATAEELDFTGFFGSATEAVLSMDVSFLFETAWPVLLPMIVGGIPNAIIAWFVFYLPLKPVVAAYQRRRRMRLMKKAVAKTQEIGDESAA